MPTRRLFRFITCLAITLFQAACAAPPSTTTPAPTLPPTATSLPSPATPTSSPVPTETPRPTETLSSTQIPTLALTPTIQTTPTQTPTMAPVFDLTKRTGLPANNLTEYIQYMQANNPQDKEYLFARWERAQWVRTNQDATDPRVLEAFLRTPRETFFRNNGPTQAYQDAVFSIGYGQTITGPHLVSRMTQAINPQPNHRVLEIGTGSGFQSAILSELAHYVYTIEIVPELAQQADARYKNMTKAYPEYANIIRKNADGYFGWPEYAPFDRIIVTAGIDHVPPDLLAQLAPGGIMVIPVGPPSGQTVLKISKIVQPDGSITFVREDIYRGHKINFVPFTGGHQGK